MEYTEFLKKKIHFGEFSGFEPSWLPDSLFDFQRALVEWAVRKGRCGIFADCGLGKTLIQLVWAENIWRKERKPLLIVTPLAVSYQTIREGQKFGIECARSTDGNVAGQITVTNYERLHLFRSGDFIGVVCDESSILKNFDGKRKAIVTEFLRTRPYRLLCTATATPNDYIELGTSSEALGELGFMDMLTRFFKNEQQKNYLRRWADSQLPKWRFKRHAETPFWRWVCSWARAVRKPSDMGFEDGQFKLLPLVERQMILKNEARLSGELFVRLAISLKEQREERRLTVRQRCRAVAELINGDGPAVAWCHLNEEGDLLERLIPGSVQVAGSDSDERKEEVLLAFSEGKIPVLVTKPRIGGFGMNWQHCAHVTFFPSHSFEQYYQAVRRCWRFGQTRPVIVDIVTSEGETRVLENLQRKAAATDRMFDRLVASMNDAERIDPARQFVTSEKIPSWL